MSERDSQVLGGPCTALCLQTDRDGDSWTRGRQASPRDPAQAGCGALTLLARGGRVPHPQEKRTRSPPVEPRGPQAEGPEGRTARPPTLSPGLSARPPWPSAAARREARPRLRRTVPGSQWPAGAGSREASRA